METWHLESEQRSAFLARLPQLSTLRVHGWPSKAALASLLTLYGDSTQGRVVHLQLSGRFINTTATCAVRAAFPNLQSLQLHSICARVDGYRAVCPQGQLPLLQGLVDGNLLLPLRHLPLIKVRVLKVSAFTCPPAMLIKLQMHFAE